MNGDSELRDLLKRISIRLDEIGSEIRRANLESESRWNRNAIKAEIIHAEILLLLAELTSEKVKK